MSESYTRIKRYISNTGLKQKKITDDIGWQESKLSQILNGRRKLSADDLMELCDYLKTTPNKILDFKNS